MAESKAWANPALQTQSLIKQPVEKGEIYEVEIEEIGSKGDGIAKVKGLVVIVPNTQKGEKVKIKIRKLIQTAAFAEVLHSSK